MATESVATIDGWVPYRVDDLYTVERDGRWLCLNPSVPSWLVTNEAGKLLVGLVNGRRSVADIGQILTAANLPVSQGDVDEFFSLARASKLFDPSPPKPDPVAEWRSRRLAAMHVHMTDRCNLSCSYCLRGSSPQLPVLHQPERFIEMFEFVKPFAANTLEITFTGGEPLMYPGFQDVIAASTQHGYHNVLFTNAVLITEARAAFIGQHFERVQVSLDGPDRASHARTRGDNFRQVVRGINRLLAAGVDLTVQVTLSKLNMESADKIHEILPEGIKLRFTPAMAHGRGDQVADIFISETDFLDFSQSASDPKSTTYRPGDQIRSCHAGLSNLSIADTGDVYPCHLFHQEKFRFGNIFHDDFTDIFYGSAIRDYVFDMDVANNNPVCAGCEVRFLCGGGCKANAMVDSGDFHGVDMWCSYLKSSIFDNLMAYDADQTGEPTQGLQGKLLPLSVLPPRRRVSFDSSM